MVYFFKNCTIIVDDQIQTFSSLLIDGYSHNITGVHDRFETPPYAHWPVQLVGAFPNKQPNLKVQHTGYEW